MKTLLTSYTRRMLAVCMLTLIGFFPQIGYADLDVGLAQNYRLVERVQIGAPYYVLPVSSMRKVNGIIGAEHTVQLSGELYSYTWQVVPGITSQQAHLQALQSLLTDGAEVLFECQGRACGSSNQWANQVFHQARLYGLDAQQSYTAFKLKGAAGFDYYAVYTIERGNHKVYLHIDLVQGKTANLGQ